MRSFFRFLGKNKLYTAINLFGLAISLTFVLLISDYSFRQLLTDSYHVNLDRLWLLKHSEGFASFYPDAPALKDEFPEIESFCRVCSGEELVFRPDSENSFASECFYADSTFFNLFSYPMLSGNRESALDSRDKCVITKSMAQKLFGVEDPIGKTIVLNKVSHQYTVSAVIADFDRTILPNDAGVVIRIEERGAIYGVDLNTTIMMGGGNSIKAFILEGMNSDLSAKSAQIKDYLNKNSMTFKYAIQKDPDIIPMKDVIFAQQNTVTGGDGLVQGDLKMIYILMSIAFAILLFAVINYVNLTVAQTGMRAKEMASRKLLGARGGEITFRFIRESVFMTAIAAFLALALATSLESKASSLFGGSISITNDINTVTVAVFIGTILLLGSISGIIPAYTISKYKPVDIVKGSLKFNSKMTYGRLFIILQNIITIVLISASITIFWQIRHLINAPLGFRTENILELRYEERGGPHTKTFDPSKLFVVRSELEQLSFIEHIGLSDATLSGSTVMWTRSSSEEGKSYTFSTLNCDREYAFDIFGLELVRNNNPAGNAYYPDEAFLDMYGLPHDTTAINPRRENVPAILGGIIKTIHIGDIISDQPAILMQIVDFAPNDTLNIPGTITVKLRDNTDIKQAIATITEVYESVTGGKLKYEFVEDVIARHFEKERKLSTIVLMFTIIAIIISTLGLLAMSTYFTRGRLSEIGVRKVFGSTTGEVISLLLWKFIRPMIISFILTIPVSWIIMDKWLETYSYRIEMNVWIILAAGIFSFVIAVFSVLWQTLTAARSNPTSLR